MQTQKKIVQLWVKLQWILLMNALVACGQIHFAPPPLLIVYPLHYLPSFFTQGSPPNLEKEINCYMTILLNYFKIWNTKFKGLFGNKRVVFYFSKQKNIFNNKKYFLYLFLRIILKTSFNCFLWFSLYLWLF